MKKIILVALLLSVSFSLFGQEIQAPSLDEAIAIADRSKFVGVTMISTGVSLVGMGIYMPSILDLSGSSESMAVVFDVFSALGIITCVSGLLLWFDGVISSAVLRNRLYEGYSENKPEEE